MLSCLDGGCVHTIQMFFSLQLFLIHANAGPASLENKERKKMVSGGRQ